MTELIIAEEHSQIYDLWIEKCESNLSICHLDFHCDMRGLLINRKHGTAQFVSKHIPYIHKRDPGSFLSHAIMEGIVTSLRWVHDEFGGRKYDLPTVKYESDLTALPYRLLPSRKVRLEYSEQIFSEWDGLHDNEHLDIDWDGIAFVDYEKDHIRTLMAQVLRCTCPSNTSRVYLVHSPDYCHPDNSLFEEFITSLENKFNTKARYMPTYQPEFTVTGFWKLYRDYDERVARKLRRRGIY